VRLVNRGSEEAVLALRIIGPDSDAFRVAGNRCPESLAAGTSCMIDIEFKAGRLGAYSVRVEAAAASAAQPAVLDMAAEVTRPPFVQPPGPTGVTREQLAASLARAARSWVRSTRHVLARRGFAVSFEAPVAGTLLLEVRRGSRAVARGYRRMAPAREAIVRARPLPFGRRLLRTRRPLRLAAKLTFIHAGGTQQLARRTVRLRRPGGRVRHP
jgi:hypothetical protein